MRFAIVKIGTSKNLGGVWPATDSDLRSGLGILKSDFGNLNQAGLTSQFKD